MLSAVRLSLLDRARTRVGESDAEALHHVLDRAKRVEQLGYHRFWVAEHHGVPGVAGSSPAVLAAAVAAATSRIRVGSGGVMLPNHSPLVVAEQFLTLEALHPGRIDLGVGRTLGFTEPVRRALRHSSADDDSFIADLDELRHALNGTGSVTARPAVATPPPLFVLGIARGLDIAAQLRLPAVIGGSLLRDHAALANYRQRAPEPPLIVSADIMIADTRERARQLLLPEAWAMIRSREVGAFLPLESVEAVRELRFNTQQQKRVDAWMQQAIYGDEASVRGQLETLLARTGAREIMATTSTFDVADRAEADARLAALFS